MLAYITESKAYIHPGEYNKKRAMISNIWYAPYYDCFDCFSGRIVSNAFWVLAISAAGTLM